MGKIVIFAAPSGSGKSTIISRLLPSLPALQFSISATSRVPRGVERDGVEYYFLTKEQFMQRVENNDFVEWEEVYGGSFYGTLHSEIDRIWGDNNVVVFDIDVQGALNIKKIFGDDALSIFIMPPSVEELEKRLTLRATDSKEAISKRLAKAKEEISYSNNFDVQIVNDNLEDAVDECHNTIKNFIK